MTEVTALKTLDTIVGLSVKVTNTFDTEYSGTIYSYTPELLVIQVPAQAENGQLYNYRFLKTAYIKNLEILQKKTDESKVAAILKMDPTQISRIIEKNTSTLKTLKETRNDNVSCEAQLVFNAVHKTVPNVRWKGNTIVVLDEVVIDSPYTVNSVKRINSDNDDPGAINLVKKIVDGVWSKIENGNKGG